MTRSQIQANPIFTGLTRPPMWLGITLDYLSLSALTSLCAFILANNALYLLIYLPLHGFGWLACQFDPNVFRLLMKRSQCPRIANHKLWKCQSYAPF